ncbi:MAG: small basic protein, partial [Planctomycetota bacterium]
GGSLVQHRSVLTRAERIAKMKENGTFKDVDRALGLPKTKSLRVSTGKKKAAKRPDAAEK